MAIAPAAPGPPSRTRTSGRCSSARLPRNIGTWMQNVVLPAYIYQRTGKASVVALLVFAQLGPLLLLAIPEGVLADRFDRRNWLIAMQLGAAGRSPPRLRRWRPTTLHLGAVRRSTRRRNRERVECSGLGGGVADPGPPTRPVGRDLAELDQHQRFTRGRPDHRRRASLLGATTRAVLPHQRGDLPLRDRRTVDLSAPPDHRRTFRTRRGCGC